MQLTNSESKSSRLMKSHRHRHSLAIGLIVLIGHLMFLAIEPHATEFHHPNVILFMADDMGMGDTSAYQDFTGNSDQVQLHTPSMERLARMGVRFTDAHTPSSRCTPTRYGLLTGREPWRTRLKHFVLFGAQGDPLIEDDRPTIATLFQDQGYHTGIVGKWHLGLLYQKPNGAPSDSLEDADLTQPIANGPVDHGFEFARFNSRSHGSSAPNRSTRKKGGPGFIHGRELVSVRDAHSFHEVGPFAYVLDKLGSRYSDHAIEFLASHRTGSENENKPFFLYYASNSNHTRHTPDTEIDGVPIRDASRYKSGQSGTTRMDFVYENDVALGRLLDWLESNDDPRHPGRKLIESTIVIFTSDNGAEVNNKTFTGPFRSHKASCYEGGHRVPFLVAWGAGGIGDGNALTPGKDNASPISLTDVYATFSQLLNVPLPNLAAGEKGAEDSISMLAFWKGSQSDRATVPMFCNDNASGLRVTKKVGRQASADPAMLMMRLDNPIVGNVSYPGQWKILFDASMIREGKANPIELYDLATDLRETTNRISENGLSDLVSHLSSVALLHRSIGGHRLVPIAGSAMMTLDFRNQQKPSLNEDQIQFRLSVKRGGETVFTKNGLGIAGNQSNQVNNGEALTISFEKDVVIESIELAARPNGSCGGFYQVDDGGRLPIYCIDSDAEKYTKTQHSGILSDVGVLKANRPLTFDSGRLYGANASGSWWLQSIRVRILKSSSGTKDPLRR
ncbi:MAG: arylsulfatase [Planctomycetota bacterium]